MHPIIHQASLTGLIRLLLIVLTVYALYSLFIRVIIPLVLRKYVNDFQQKFTNENQRMQQEQNRAKEGEISIEYVKKDKSSSRNPNDGEYVDYEEIK